MLVAVANQLTLVPLTAMLDKGVLAQTAMALGSMASIETPIILMVAVDDARLILLIRIADKVLP